MLIKVSPLIFISLVFFTVPLNVLTSSPTGKPTQDCIQDTTGFWTDTVESSKVFDIEDQTLNTIDSCNSKQTLNTKDNCNAYQTNNVFVINQNAPTKTEDFSSNSGPQVGKWDNVDAFLKFQIRGMLDSLNLKDVIRRTNASDTCKTSLERYMNSLYDLEPWTIKMADANGRVAGGVLEGRFTSLGSFEECLKIRVDSGVEQFQGQFCMVAYTSPLLRDVYLKNGSLNRQYLETYGEPPKWIRDFLFRAGPHLKRMLINLGTCAPSTCSDQDLAQIITQIVAPLGLSVEVAGCQVEKPIEWTKGLIAAVSVLSGIAILCILGTVADVANVNQVSKKEKSNHSKYTTLNLLKMFSLPSNLEIFANSDNSKAFGCLDGIRFLSVTWIVLFHTYYSVYDWDYHKFRNVLAYKENFRESFLLAAFDNALLAIVSFFFVSGFLMSYLMWKKLEKKSGKLNFVVYFLHKYWRFTPCIALTLAAYVVVDNTASGPLSRIRMDPEMTRCQTNWLTTFLYIGNWWDLDEMCMSHTWFMACLMQFQVIGFFIIQATFRWPAVGVFLAMATVVGCCALIVVVAVWKQFPFPNTMLQKDHDVLLMWSSWVRFKPYYYIQSYIIGMFVGYLVLKYKDKKIKQRYHMVGWILSVLGSFYALFGILGPEASIAFYYAFSFTAWSASLGWLIYACVAGYGGIINRFLSWKGFHLLNNISYLTYLLHIVVIDYNMASLKEVVNYGHYEMICTFLGTMTVSICLAFVGHVTVEMPLHHLEKLIF